MSRWYLAPLALLVAVVAGGAPSASANPIDAFGYGARASSMAGTQTAASDDAGANYYNPALLASYEQIVLDIGYQLAMPTLQVSDLDTNVDDSRGLTVGLVVPGQLAGRRLAIGTALYLPDQHINRIRTLASSKPRFVVYDNRPQRLFMSANLSLQITDKLYVGGGMGYMSSSEGTVLLDGRISLANPDASELDLAMDVDLKSIRYFHAGIWYDANPWLKVGASYRGGFALTLDQVFRINGDIGTAEEPVVEDGFFELHTVSQDLFQPEEFTVGVSAQITPSLALALDVGWHRWSRFENPAANIEIDLDVGSFNDLIDIAPSDPLPEAGFHDIIVPRLGLEWSALNQKKLELMVRGGYLYEPSPVPWQLGATNFIDNDKHTVSVGSGFVLRNITDVLLQPFSIDLSLALTMLAPRNHIKLSPVDPVGSFRSSGRIVAGSVSTRWRF